MRAGKLGRREDVRWEPPVLSFRMKRQRAMGVGSTRAELQNWRVDLDRKTAKCERSRSYRQALPRAEGVRIEPIERELARAYPPGVMIRGLKWQGDGADPVCEGMTTEIEILGTPFYLSR
jgi:hypothetical protein